MPTSDPALDRSEEAWETMKAENADVQGVAPSRGARDGVDRGGEHDMYMRLINCWAERSGFGTYVVPREGADAGDGLSRCSGGAT